MKVVLLIGKAGVGKDEAYKCIKEIYPTAERYAFAVRLKVFAREMGWDGRKDERGRKLLQGIGQTVRAYNEDFWAVRVVRAIEHDQPDIAVITDCRFPNEIKFVKAFFRDTTTLKILRNGVEDLDDISIEDKKIFLELKRRGEKSKTWSLEAAKDSQRRDIIKDLDEISESIEESLKKQESLY